MRGLSLWAGALSLPALALASPAPLSESSSARPGDPSPAKPIASQGQARAPREVPLEVEADALKIDPEASTALFEGHVTARRGGLTLRCDRVTARYTEGEIDHLLAEGHIALTGQLPGEGGTEGSGGEITATASRARYDHREGVLTLTGQPTLTRRGDRLQGAQVRYWPDTGRVEVDQPRGRVSLSALSRSVTAHKSAASPVTAQRPVTTTPAARGEAQ